ncbi:hypothetical protein DL93DRAFT_2118386 [Clavulina sp. PMI_390]|nr:hypothetical protein DL93DRAFT_2118386 [Clavulina sp. PMI_390]
MGLAKSIGLMSYSRVLRLCRFTHEDITKLTQVLQLPKTIRTQNNSIFYAHEALAILLARLASSGTLSSLTDVFGYSETQLSGCINATGELIITRWQHLLAFSETRFTPSTLDMYAKAVRIKGCPSHQIWGFIDCTIMPLCRPTRNQRTVYNGYKRQHALKYQGVTLPNGIVLCYGPEAGRRADGAVLKQSGLVEALRKHAVGTRGQRLFLYGDPAYGEGDIIMSGLKKVSRLTSLERDLNKEMSRYRQCAEWSFGKVTTLFPFTRNEYLNKLGLSAVGRHFLLSVLFTNAHTCLYGSETSRFYGLPPPLLDSYFC